MGRASWSQCTPGFCHWYGTNTRYILFIFLFSWFFTGCIYWAERPNFVWPVKNPNPVSRAFSVYHEGVDFAKNVGTPVLATARGRVAYTGSQVAGYGKIVVIEHSHKWSSLYAHLSQVLVKNGVQVQAGEKIGLVGNTGRTTGPHLHFELLYDKTPVNPLLFLPD